MLPGKDSSTNNQKSEVLPPVSEGSDSRTAIYAEIIANINKYTERPDLFLETIEKHDSGFIKRMNREAEEFSKKSRNARFKFGQMQAYAALSMMVVSALCCLVALIYLIYEKQAGFWSFVGIALVYAVTQSGPKGFLSLIEGIKKVISGKSPSEKN